MGIGHVSAWNVNTGGIVDVAIRNVRMAKSGYGVVITIGPSYHSKNIRFINRLRSL